MILSNTSEELDIGQPFRQKLGCALKGLKSSAHSDMAFRPVDRAGVSHVAKGCPFLGVEKAMLYKTSVSTNINTIQ